MGAVEMSKSIKENRIPGEAKEILQLIATEWTDVIDPSALQVIPLKGAMTNEVYQIKWRTTAGETSRKVLVRIYGEGVEVFLDRGDEIRTFEFMSKNGQGPQLLGRFPNGRIEEFINARTLSASDLRNLDISTLIAIKLKEFHDLNMPGPKEVLLWDRLRNWLTAAQRLSSPEEAKAFHLEVLEDEISELEKVLSGDHQHVGFCHNDLQYGNIMMEEKARAITIIDYEYASYNPIAYDIANHFCEMAADYHTDAPHILDFSKYPGLEERRRFIHVYLSSSGNQPSDHEIKQLDQDVEKYTLASHLLWGLWGIISEHVNEIDFDYMEYARQRLQRYWLRKPEILHSVRAAPHAIHDDPPESATSVSLGYGIAIAVSILVLISTIMLASYACVRIKSGTTTTSISSNNGLSRSASGGMDDGGGGSSSRRQPNYSNSLLHSTTINTLPGPMLVKVGLQQRPMIESCTEMILGESKRLPRPNNGPCSICLGDYRPKEVIRCMPDCNHCFHSSCIDQWLRMSPTCPLCRSSPAPSVGVTPVGTPLAELVPLAFVR
ncbi:hypothetical protein Ancab_006148 [Ancistrocladus abbreviatus]